jgi:ADP-ribose pyrophosphatase YjhB (NUDIX family)
LKSHSSERIIENNKILLNKCFDKNNGDYYSLPGGGHMNIIGTNLKDLRLKKNITI